MAETGGFLDTHTTSTYSPTTTTQTASPRVRCTIDKGYATSLPSIIRIVEILTIMAETGGFPDTHTTSTYSPTTTQQTASPRVQCTIDKGYATSLPSIIRIVEIIVGFMYWTVVSSYWFGCVNHSTGWYNWVIFVSVTTWVITVILFIFFLLSLTKQVTIINWVLTELINNAAACLLHFIAAIFISIKAGQPAGRYEHGKIIWGCLEKFM
ncbi:plasmolipin-like [Strongylocentrotus purpuratus]|uniref:MARVEL domain-containing protein n=1 Tax=Strongylocentrotus purpuratus TaxID=7668 RepID=A0A7M7N6Q1_STRPU|nr:plasmolipin-like [Strongylocentrotus purpuratus]